MKNKFLAFCMIVILSSIGAAAGITDVQAAAGAKEAYRNILLQSGIAIDGTVLPKDGTSFCVKDLNHDGTPELLLIHKGASYGDSSMVIATYYKNEVKQLYNDMWREDIVKVYSKGSIFYIQSQMTITFKNYYQIKKGKLKNAASYNSDSDFMNGGPGGGKPEYILGTKKVTKEKFQSWIKEKTKGSGAKKLKFSSLTEENVNKI